MRESTDELVRNALQALADADAVTDDALLAPHAASLADAAEYLAARHVELEGLLARRRRYLELAANFSAAGADMAASAAWLSKLAETFPAGEAGHSRNLLKAAKALSRAGRYTEAMPLLERVAELARVSGDKRFQHAALIQLAPALSETGRPLEALTHLQTVIDQAADTGMRGVAAVNAALAAIVLGRPGQAVELAGLGVRWCTEAGNHGAALRGREALSTALAAHGEFGRALQVLDEVESLARPTGDAWLLASLQGNRGSVLVQSGDVHAGRLVLERAYEQFSAIGDSASIAGTCMNLGVALLEEGYPRAAQGHFRHAATQYERLDISSRRSNARLNLAEALLLDGDTAEAWQILQDESACADAAETGLACFWHALAGQCHAARQDADAARAEFASVLRLAGGGNLPADLARAACAAAKFESGQRCWPQALALADQAAEALKGAGPVAPLALVDTLALGARAARELGDRDGMKARLLRALELADELPLLARSEGPRATALIAELRELEAAA